MTRRPASADTLVPGVLIAAGTEDRIDHEGVSALAAGPSSTAC
ncbi:hypothetical protein [Amycolatopsis tolypomycina]|uniref:Uncharacterized protein n=1 Tax=Amycolatopsis tolypomycina TaxID=208445 RepID=A0A1H5BNT5_9PSEU|nr:hypothetical protein [Amycolatopsis tolypomycina]SED55948.1 hypothetical protein SAMN04489727_8367 [Amycolatopsis tolypomycina]